MSSVDKKIQNLFVVDWMSATSEMIENLLNNPNMPVYDWTVYNCRKIDYTGGGKWKRFISYFSAVLHILKNKKKYDNIIIWQPIIGYILFLFPRFYSAPKIIVTSLLFSPRNLQAVTFHKFQWKQSLKKADALLYFSDGMAEDVKTVYPRYASKIFSVYLPVLHSLHVPVKKDKMKDVNSKTDSVFTGGISDRDFDTVIKAFTNTDVPVTIVCHKFYDFSNPELITGNFTILRDVSESDYFSLIQSSSIVVIALKSGNSPCGQILFTYCMKCGIPIIATDCLATRDYIRNNDNGILVPARDDRAIFDAYKLLVNDNAFREKLVKNSTETSEKMTFANFLFKIDSIIQKIK